MTDLAPAIRAAALALHNQYCPAGRDCRESEDGILGQWINRATVAVEAVAEQLIGAGAEAERLRILGDEDHAVTDQPATPDGQLVTGFAYEETNRLKDALQYVTMQRDWLAAEAGDEVRARYFRVVAEMKADGLEPAPLPPFDPTMVRTHPGTGQPMTVIEHPADGTLSPEHN